MPARTPIDAELVGTGLTADVYAWGEGRVLKLLRERYGRSSAEREYMVTRTVREFGIPAPMAHEVVEVGGRYGIVFDRVIGITLLQYFQSHPWALFAGARQLAELHARLHECTAPDGIPSQHEQIGARIDSLAELSESEKDAARRVLSGLPEGTSLCHGDFHPGNIIMTDNGPVIIDWGWAARGNPSGDVACTSRLFERASLPESTPAHLRLLFGMSRTLLHENYLRRYLRLRPGTREEIAAWRVPLRAAAPTLRLRGNRQ